METLIQCKICGDWIEYNCVDYSDLENWQPDPDIIPGTIYVIEHMICPDCVESD